MDEPWNAMLPILAVDVVNPALLAVVVVAVAAPRPYARGVAVIAGHMIAYFLLGLVVLFGFAELLVRFSTPLLERVQHPEAADFAISLGLGVLLVIAAWWWKMSASDDLAGREGHDDRGIVSTFLFGVSVCVVGLPFAVPYFVFLSDVALAPPQAQLPALALFNLCYAVPFLMVPACRAVFGQAALPTLVVVRHSVARLSSVLLPALVAILGLAMVADAGAFFATGEGLI